MKHLLLISLVLLTGWGMSLPAAKGPVILVCPNEPPVIAPAHCLEGLSNGVWSLQLTTSEAIRVEVFNPTGELLLQRKEFPVAGEVRLSFSLGRYPAGSYEALVHFPEETVRYSLEKTHP